MLSLSPRIPGSDIAGEVAKVGPGVSTVRSAEKVGLAPALPAANVPRASLDRITTVRKFTNLGYLIDDGSAEYVRVPEVNCFPYPENLD